MALRALRDSRPCASTRSLRPACRIRSGLTRRRSVGPCRAHSVGERLPGRDWLAGGGVLVKDASQDRGQLDDGIHGDDCGEPGVLLRDESDEPSLLAPGNVSVGQISRNEANYLGCGEPAPVPTKNLIRTVCVTDRAVLGRRTITSVGMADVRSVEVDGRSASFGRFSGRRVSVHGLQAPAIRGCGQAACRW